MRESPGIPAVTVTPTQAYLSVPSLNALVHKDWKNELVAYNDIIDAMKKKEQELNDTTMFFIMAQNDVFRLLHDFLNASYEELYCILRLMNSI